MTSTLQDAISAVRVGNYEEAQRQLAEVIRDNPDEVQAWYLLSQIVDSDARRAVYLSKTLALNPFHERAWAEFFSLPTEVVSRLEPGETPVAVVEKTATAVVEEIEVPAPSVNQVNTETALPDWLRPVAKDQPVVAQRRTSTPPPASKAIPAPQPQSVPAQLETAQPEPAQSNRTLSILLAILLIATLVVLAFLIYLLLQG
ncbi:MAG: hypothetical protein R3C44_13185 [Chloroflexota bacterium]